MKVEWTRTRTNATGKIIVQAQFIPEESDACYDNYLSLEIGLDGAPTGKMILHSVFGKEYSYNPGTTDAIIKADLTKKLDELVASQKEVDALEALQSDERWSVSKSTA